MTGTSLCALQALRIDRIYFFGDSLARSQFVSLINKMGHLYIEHVVHEHDDDDDGGKDLLSATLVCNNNNNNNNNNSTTTRVPMLFANEGGGNAFPDSPKINMTLSSRSRSYLNPPSCCGHRRHHERKKQQGRLLAVLNIGAHYHTYEDYQEDIEQLFRWCDELLHVVAGGEPNEKDLVFFRTTPSGHGNCEPRNTRQHDFAAGIRLTPLTRYAHFVPTTKHDWNLFDSSNDYTKMVLRNRTKQQVRIRLLDVVHMTLLRQDGHAGGPDCLHYVEPGPVDWWNHLLYILLHRILQMEKAQGTSHVG